MIYHVSPAGYNTNPGTMDAPWRTINHAAQLAEPGDRVIVHAGEYRERVDPRNGGSGEQSRILYEAADHEHVVIKGSEVITGWTHVQGSIWKKAIPNTLFGAWNPFALPLAGDWLMQPTEPPIHLGDVYLNGVALYEATSYEALCKGELRTSGYQVHWNSAVEPILYPEETRYQWYAEVTEEETTLWCNFQATDPNTALVEISVRQNCFYPSRMNINYITVRGFEMCHAATPWAPPTADQPGMIGPHWAKGWIIENNHLHHARCAAISLGKFDANSHNLYTRHGRKPGYQYQLEAVFEGLRRGWSRENIGSHIVRNNVIHDCGQNGVVGHMGCAFSLIEHNHIYNIGVKREFFGYEIAGIKLHAAIDTCIRGNNIHHCELGTWLDWQAQGMRITQNIYHHNDRDFMIEVTHGPCTVDNNIFASAYNVDNVAQGTAWLHNLFCGFWRRAKATGRSTPYHLPHSTQVAGGSVTYSGDDRIIGNIFTGEAQPHAREDMAAGTCIYDVCTTPDEYHAALAAEGNTDDAKYGKIQQPVWVSHNQYAGCARPFRAEEDCSQIDAISTSVTEKDGVYWLSIDLPAPHSIPGLASTQSLGTPRMTEAPYENPDGTPLSLTLDVSGQMRTEQVFAGPLAHPTAGKMCIPVWQ